MKAVFLHGLIIAAAASLAGCATLPLGLAGAEGRADIETPAGTRGANRTAAVERLAEALFRDFPGESGRTIRLP